MTTNNSRFSPFLPSTVNFPEDEERKRFFFVDIFARYADVINQKKIGQYTPSESYNGENWRYITPQVNRSGYQVIIQVPSLPNATTMAYALPISNIDSKFVVTLLYGNASLPADPTNSLPTGDYFSFMSQGDSRITFTMDDTNLTVTTTTDLSSYSGIFVIHYLRNGV